MKLKNKILHLVVACAFAITTAFCLTACGGGNEKSVSHCGMTINDVDYGTNHYIDLGSFDFTGNNPITSYTVYAVYDDDSQATLETGEYDYQMSYSDLAGNNAQDGFPDQYPAGNYQLKITYEIWEISVNFTIQPAANSNQFSIVPTLGSLNITFGQSQPTIDFNSASKQTLTTAGFDLNKSSDAGKKFYDDNCRYIEASAVANPQALTENELNQAFGYRADVELFPGQYYLFITVPAYGNYAASHSNLLRFTIHKAQLVVESADENVDELIVTYDYDRSNNHIGDFTAQDILTLDENLNQSITATGPFGTVHLVKTFADPTQSLNAENDGDKLTVNFAFEESYADFARLYELPAPVEVTLKVKKATIEKPTISAFNDTITIAVGTATNRLWQVCTFTLTKPDGSTETLDFSGDAYENSEQFTVTEDGKYTVTITLKDPTNYTWQDGSTDAVVQELDITIAA